MKNFILLVCLVCCQIAVSQCSLEDIAKRMHIPLEYLTECRDRTGISESNLDEFFATPVENVKSSLNEELVASVGCFLACIMEKTGMMNGAKIERGALTEALKSAKNSDMVARLLNNVEACADSVEGLDYSCEVAMNFHQCLHASPTRQQ